MSGLRTLRLICASLAAAVALAALACLLPDNPYQRWQLVDGTIYEQLRWAYERIRYDPRPVDVAILGPSKALLGLSAGRVAEQLEARRAPALVANFAVVAAGRNVQWAIVNELFREKAPKVIVLAVDDAPWAYGHPAFRLVAPAGAVAFPPTPLLHNYLEDLAALPARQVRLFAARLFPGLSGLRPDFDPALYAATRSDFTSGVLNLDGKTFDMDRSSPAETLRAEIRTRRAPNAAERAVGRIWTNDDQAYVAAITELAKAHGARLLFASFPTFDGRQTIEDRAFLAQRGQVIDNGDLATDASVFENWSHLNHRGATIVSDRVAAAIADMRISRLSSPTSTPDAP